MKRGNFPNIYVTHCCPIVKDKNLQTNFVLNLFDSGLRSESIETRESVFTRAEQASSKTTVESRTSNCTSDSNCTILCHITPGFTIEKADEELDKPNKTPEDIEFEDTVFNTYNYFQYWRDPIPDIEISAIPEPMIID